MLVNDQIVVKLPAGRVVQLISSGGAALRCREGKPMKEWVGLMVDEDASRELVAEAMAFVGGRASSPD
jgi:hypothetical protein